MRECQWAKQLIKPEKWLQEFINKCKNSYRVGEWGVCEHSPKWSYNCERHIE
jgi:hypothetical protein